jgi:hypothetical protein
MATTNDSRDKPMAEPGKQQAGEAKPAAAPSRPAGAPASGAGPAAEGYDDDDEPWRHPPVAPRDESPLKSLGRSVSDAVTGSVDDKPAKPKA